MTASDDLNLSASERLALEELRRRISKDLEQKVYDETYFLYRYLKARSFSVDQAEHMIRKNLEWKKQVQIDSIMTHKFPEVLSQYLKNLHIAYEKDGSPLFYIPLGKIDVKGLFMSVKVSEVEKFCIHFCESAEKLLEKQCKKLCRRLSGVVLVYDTADLSFATASDKKAIETLIRIIKFMQDNYPERLKAVIIMNASSIFTIGFSLVKSFVAASILQKIFIYGTDGWKEDLLNRVDKDKLPAFLGGSKTDPDGNPLCLTTVNHGGKIDEKYIIHKAKKSLSSKPNVKKLVISRASFSEIIMKIEEEGSLIEWEFETKTRDVGFGLFYREMIDGEEKCTELVPLQRLDTEEFAETGIYKCEKAGTYVMLFDNSYSWIRSKELYYRATVVRPKDHEKEINT